MYKRITYKLKGDYKKKTELFIVRPMLAVLIFLSLFSVSGTAQVGINTTDVDFSSILDIQSTDKGVLFPRLTAAQKNAMGTVPAGLMIYCSDCCVNGTGSLYQHNGTKWGPLDSSCVDNGTPECYSMVTTIVEEDHMDPDVTPPLLIDGFLYDVQGVEEEFLKMHGDGEDEVKFEFNATLLTGYKVQLYFRLGKGNSGITAKFKVSNSLRDTVNSESLPSNASLTSIPGGTNKDFMLTTTLLSDTDEVYVTANDEHPYLWEIKVFDSNNVEIPLSCP